MEIIITNGFIAIISIIVLWKLLYYFLTKVLKYNNLDWKKLDYFWIFAGIFGLLTMISKNKIELNNKKAIEIQKDIDLNYSNLNLSLNSNLTCFTYNITKNSPENIEDRQYDQDEICKWSKKTLNLINQSSNNKTPVKLEELKIELKTNFKSEFHNSIIQRIKKNNELINKLFNIKSSTAINDFVIRIWNVIGAFSLIVAFAIRLAITTHNINELKTRHNNNV